MGEIYEVKVQGRFSAVHQLRLADGSLEPVHGHDWNVEVVFRGDRLDAVGMLIDFEDAASALRRVLAEFNYHDLNTLVWLENQNPSAERVARAIFERMHAHLGSDCPLAGVCVEEAPGCRAAFWVQSPNA